MTVNKADGLPQPGAIVAIYDNEDKYKADNAAFTVSGAVFTDTTDTDGKCNFTKLDADKQYYVAAYYKDTVTLKQYGYDMYHDNGVTGYRLLRTLNQSSKTFANITLTPAESLVAFYASNSPGNIPITVLLDGQSLGTLDTSYSNLPPNTILSGMIVKKFRRGTYPIQLINDIDCNSINVVNVIGGVFQPINTNICDAGAVSFWTVTENSKVLPIAITLDVDNTIGSLNTGQFMDTPPTNPKTSANVFNYVLSPGDYTYVAKSGSCVWQGKFSILPAQYTVVKLDRCF